MNVEEKLRCILVDLYCQNLEKLEYDDEDIIDFVGDDDFTFIKEHLDEFTTEDMIDNLYENLFYYFYIDNDKDNIFSCNEECTRYAIANYLIAYIYRNYIVFHYDDPEYDLKVKTLAEMKYSILRSEYYNNEIGTKKLLRCLIHSLVKPEVYENNYKLMKQNNEEYLIEKLDSRCNDVSISLNDFLRIIFNQYYKKISKYNTLRDTLDFSVMWLFNTEDINNTFANMNLSENQILYYKEYLRKLIIADVYEDSQNHPEAYFEELNDQKKEIIAVYSSVFAITCNKELKDYSEEQIKYIVYHYINLIQDESRTHSNRDATIGEKRIKLLTKYNPSFMFDEF